MSIPDSGGPAGQEGHKRQVKVYDQPAGAQKSVAAMPSLPVIIAVLVCIVLVAAILWATHHGAR